MKMRFFVAAGIGFLLATTAYFSPRWFQPGQAELHWNEVSQTNSVAYINASFDYFAHHGYGLLDVTGPASPLLRTPQEKETWIQCATQAMDYLLTSKTAETNSLLLRVPRQARLTYAAWINSKSAYLFNLSFLALVIGLIWPRQKTG